MKNLFRTVLHCEEDNSDKVYIVEVNKLGENRYQVNTLWGRRQADTLTSRTFAYNELMPAHSEAVDIVHKKEKKGYEEVDYALYETSEIDIPALDEYIIMTFEVPDEDEEYLEMDEDGEEVVTKISSKKKPTKKKATSKKVEPPKSGGEELRKIEL